MTPKEHKQALGSGQVLVLRHRGTKVTILEGAEGIADLDRLIEFDMIEAERFAGLLAEIVQSR